MSRLIRYLRGSVRFRLTGAAPEQCLNALAAARLEFWDIEREDALHLSLSVPAREAERLQELALRCLCTAEVTERSGLRAQFGGLLRRPVLLLGLLAAAVATFVLQEFVWTIEVEGNDRLPAGQIVQALEELGIAPDFYKTKDVHIHFPEGAIPKDGPSAGIAIATAVLSALTGQAVHRDVAMTGEITLRGRVLAIGGLREKTMGALRAGVHTVILPKENEKDLDEIDPLVREKLRFVPVETVDAVFAEALVLPEKCTAAAHESYLPPVQESAHSALRAGEMS